MDSKIVAILLIAFSYTSKSVTLVNEARNGTIVIGELNEIHPQVEPELRRDDNRIKMICSNLTEPGDNRNDEYEIAKFVAGKNLPTICRGAVEPNHETTDDNKLTREEQQLIENYRFKREFSDSEMITHRKRELMKREITRISGRNKVDKYGPPEDPESEEDEKVTQEVNKADEEVEEQTSASNGETVENSKSEEADSTKDEEEHVEEQDTTPKNATSEEEKVPSDEQEDSDESTETVAESHDGEMSPPTTELPHSESSENSDEPTKSSVSHDEDIASSMHEVPHLSTPNNYDDTTEIDEENEDEDSEDKAPFLASDREDVHAFINKLDHILETCGDYIIALMLNNYKRRMRTDHVNERFWNKVRGMTSDTTGNLNKAKRIVQRKIKARFGRPFVKEVASTIKSFVEDVGPEFRRRN